LFPRHTCDDPNQIGPDRVEISDRTPRRSPQGHGPVTLVENAAAASAAVIDAPIFGKSVAAAAITSGVAITSDI
jgi:hypothetical protein